MEQVNIIGFCAGAFDLVHPGHILAFKEYREQCDWLVVALQVDPSVDRPEKHSPIEDIEERMIRLGGCKWVDEIIIYNTEEDLYKLLQELKPDIRFLGEDHRNKPFTGDDLEIKIVYSSRNHNYSSSNLRQRILEADQKKVR